MVKNKNELSFLILFNFIVKKYLGFDIEKMGFFPYDTNIGRSLKDSCVYYNVTDDENRGCFIDIVNRIVKLNDHK